MSNQQLQEQPKQPPLAVTKALFGRDDVKQKFQELLGKRSASFITSVLQIVASSKQLAQADPTSIYHAAAVAATMDLPINNQLGYAYIVPYKQKQGNSYITVAQFQMGYKGFIQLAQRSGVYKTISATDVREGELKGFDRLRGEYIFEWEKDESKRMGLQVIGYAAYFELLNGFEKTDYKDIAELKKHGAKYSKTFNDSNGRWNTDFESMAIKTVLKLLISKYGPLSIEMQRAVTADQGVINDLENGDVTYPDNEPETPESKEDERIKLMISDCKTLSDLIALLPHVPEHLMNVYDDKHDELNKLNA